MNQANPRSFGQLITDTVADFQRLVRQEIDLAVAELKVSGRNALMGSILLISALGVLSVAGLLIIVSIALGINALGVPLWLAFLLDALLFVLIAAVMLLIAKNKASKVKAPTRAADNLERAVNEITESIANINPQA